MWTNLGDYSGFVDNPQSIHRTSVYKSVDNVDNVGNTPTRYCVNQMSIPESRETKNFLTMISKKESV